MRAFCAMLSLALVLSTNVQARSAEVIDSVSLNEFAKLLDDSGIEASVRYMRSDGMPYVWITSLTRGGIYDGISVAILGDFCRPADGSAPMNAAKTANDRCSVFTYVSYIEIPKTIPDQQIDALAKGLAEVSVVRQSAGQISVSLTYATEGGVTAENVADNLAVLGQNAKEANRRLFGTRPTS